MKLFIVASLLCLVALATSIQIDSFFPRHGLTPLVKAKEKSTRVSLSTINQPLDHFNPQNNGQWKMRFMSNDQFFKAGGPIFVMLGGEWIITADFLLNGQMFEMAKENNAHMLYTEHRFYGQSYPTGNLSVDSLKKYFNTDQALADVVFLLRNLKAVNPVLKNSKVVVFGGSYSATMATWIREKYPDDIFAAVSSSAPLNLKTDFSEYYEVVGKVLGKECSGMLTRAYEQVLQLFGTPEGANKVSKDFNTCKPINSNDIMQVSRFFQTVTNIFSNQVQYNNCGAVQNLCNNLIGVPNMDDYTKISTLIRESLASQGQCFPTFPDIVEQIRNETIVFGAIDRQWIFQNCFQIGVVPTTTSPNQPFKDTVPLETAVYKSCEAFFGSDNQYAPIDTTLGVKRYNMIYGGLKPNITRVVSVHGLNDPWSTIGLTEDLNPLAPVILVPGASHTFDLADINQCDNQDMINAKLAVRRYIKEWLNA